MRDQSLENQRERELNSLFRERKRELPASTLSHPIRFELNVDFSDKNFSDNLS